jgi:hypothetical protein
LIIMLSGLLLDRLQSGGTRSTLDLGGVSAGTCQLAISDLRVDSVLGGQVNNYVLPHI